MSKITYNTNRYQLRKTDTFIAILAITTLLVGLIEHRIYYQNENESNITTNLLRILNILLTAPIIWLI